MAQSGQPPLVGIKVLDLSRIIAGPLCCQQMADMGADVLKVENPKTGDDSRNATKPWVGKDSHFFQAFNRNKRSIGLDFREGEGKEIFFKLMAEAVMLGRCGIRHICVEGLDYIFRAVSKCVRERVGP